MDTLIRLAQQEPGIRPQVKKLIADEFNLIKVAFLSFPAEPERSDLIEHPEKVPTFYRDALLKYARIFEQLGPNAIQHSQQIIYSLSTYSKFLTRLSGNPITVSNTFAQACQSLTGPQRDITCYYIIKRAQQQNQPTHKALTRFQAIVPPDSPYLRVLLKHYELTDYPLLTDNTFQDMVVNHRGDTLKLRDVLANMKDSLVYIDVWASWCAPCLLGMPHTQALAKKYGNRKFKVMYISIDTSPEKWKEAAEKHLPTAPESYRLIDNAQAVFFKKFKIESIPRYLIIDANATVRQHKALAPDHPELPNIIEPLLKDSRPK